MRGSDVASASVRPEPSKRICDCELDHNGLGYSIRECDCTDKLILGKDALDEFQQAEKERRELVQWALDRMSRPLDDTILPSAGATASGDARCMEIIRNYVADLEAKVQFHDDLDRSLSYAHDSLKQRTAIIDRIWDILGRPTYEALGGRTIYDLVTDARDDARRYRYLRDHCSSHYPMTHEQPAEWSIGWEFQQRTPEERYGSFDSWIDRDIAEREARQAEIDAEEAANDE